MNKNSSPSAFMLLALTLMAHACASAPTRYMHPNADLGAIQKVAVLPFENVSGVAGASDKVHKIFLVELLSTEAFDVIEPGQVSRAIKSESVTSPDQLAPDDFKRIGGSLKADALVLGQVVDYSEGRGSAGAAEVTLQFRLVETTSGVTVWTSSQTQGGVKASTRLFGTSPAGLSDITRSVIRAQLKTLLQ